MNKPILIRDAEVYIEQGIISNGFVQMENGIIRSFGTEEQLLVGDFIEYSLPASYKVILGMIFYQESCKGIDAVTSGQVMQTV